jgi:hypothetical protein
MPMNPRLLRPLASGFNPKTISGLEAWYAADVASSITIATGVQQWSDLSGKGRHLIQNVTNNQPAYNSVTLNGKPTVTFDGTNDSLRTAEFLLPQPFSFFMVFRFSSSAATGQRVVDFGKVGVARSGEFIRIGNRELSLFSGVIMSGAEFPVGSLEAFNVWDAENNGSSSIVRYRKNVHFISGNAGTAIGQRITMGADLNNPAGTFADISMAEFLTFSRLLSVTEADKIRSYLGKKYNLAYQA